MSDTTPAEIAILRRLAARRARVEISDPGKPVMIGANGARGRVEATAVRRLTARGLLAAGNGGLVLTATGRAVVRRHLAGAEDYAAQHQARAQATIDDEAFGRIQIAVNQNESPLVRLRARKGLDRRPLIGAAEFAAGERLRSDFTRGQLMPRVTSNWSAAVASGRRGGPGRSADLTEASLSARRRVERALASVGPELSGLLVDLCCFLKGLEEIERERKWPPRSAKVVLRLALAALARHYGLAATASGVANARTRHWGSDDYRPLLD